MPELAAEERAAAILDRLPIAFQEKHGEVFLAWVSQAIRDAEAGQRERDAKIAEGASEGYGSNTARMVSDEIARTIRQG